MGHHYLPQYYLRGFAVESSVWVYDKQTKKEYQTQVKSTANETGLYSPELETFITEEIEAPAKDALDRVRRHEALNRSERRSLARYVAFFWQRVPRARERALGHIPRLADEVHGDLIQDLDRLAEESPGLAEQVALLKVQAVEVNARYKATPLPELWQDAMLLHQNPRVVDAIHGRSWKFMVTKRQFLTCDNPLFFYEHEGVGKPQSEVFFPVSSSVALVASHQRRDLDGRFFHAKPELVKELNRRTAHNTQRFAYARTRERWILPFLLKDERPLPRIG